MQHLLWAMPGLLAKPHILAETGLWPLAHFLATARLSAMGHLPAVAAIVYLSVTVHVSLAQLFGASGPIRRVGSRVPEVRGRIWERIPSVAKGPLSETHPLGALRVRQYPFQTYLQETLPLMANPVMQRLAVSWCLNFCGWQFHSAGPRLLPRRLLSPGPLLPAPGQTQPKKHCGLLALCC